MSRRRAQWKFFLIAAVQASVRRDLRRVGSSDLLGSMCILSNAIMMCDEQTRAGEVWSPGGCEESERVRESRIQNSKVNKPPPVC